MLILCGIAMMLEEVPVNVKNRDIRIVCEHRIWTQKPLHHVHDYAQLILPVKGILEIAIEDAINKSIQDELVFVPPQAVHTFCNREDGEVIVFDIREEWSSQWQKVKGFAYKIDSVWAALRTLVEHELKLGSRRTLQLEKFGDYALQLLNLDKPLSIRYIQENFRDALNVPLLAELEHFSVGHYHKWFAQVTGTTPAQYIRQLRIEWAKNLLRTSELAVCQIAWEVEYANQATLSRLFSDDVGISPVMYRKKMREMDKK
jgi:AraC-like DNA-binding protein